MQLVPLKRTLTRRSGSQRTFLASLFAAGAVIALHSFALDWLRSTSLREFAEWLTIAGSLGAFGILFGLYRLSVEHLFDVFFGIEHRLVGTWQFFSIYSDAEGKVDRRFGTAQARLDAASDVVFEGVNFRDSVGTTQTSVWSSLAVGIEGHRISLLFRHSSAGKLGASGLMTLDLMKANKGLALAGTFSDAGAGGHVGTIAMFKSSGDFDAALKGLEVAS